MGLGKTYSTSYLADSNNNTGADGQVLVSTTTGINWLDATDVPGNSLWLASGNDIYSSNSGSVGIGTTAPGQKLDVSGSIAANSIFLYDSTSNDRNVLELDASDNLQIATGTSTGSRAITFRTENVEKMRITSTGNVGIGTTSPDRKIHVEGGYYLKGGAGNTSYVADGLWGATATPNLLNSTGGNLGLRIGYQDNGSGLYSPAYGFEVKSTDGIPVAGRVQRAIVIKDVDTGLYPFYINNNGSAFFDGNVGIGTTSPQSQLHVRLADGTYVRAANSTSNVSSGNYWGFGLYEGTALSAAFRIVRDGTQNQVSIGTHNNQSFAFWQNAAERMRIDVGGNVGIGTTAPANLLQVNSPETTSASDAYINVFSGHQASGGSDTTGEAGVLFRHYTGTQYFKAGGVVSGREGNYSTTSLADSYLRFETAANNVNTERMRITSAGDVTIQTSGADDIKNLTINSSNGSSQVAGFIIQNDGNNGYVHFKAGSGGGTPTTKLTIGNAANSGNVGIGTTTPTQKLEVNGIIKSISTGAAHLILNGDTNNTGDSGDVDAIIDLLGDGNPGIYGYRINTENWSGQTALNFQEYLNGTYTSRLFISKTGNLGIGTTAPENKLHVQQPGLYDGTHTTAGIRIKSDGAGADTNYHGTIALSRGTGSVAMSAVQEATDSDVMGIAFFTHPSATGGDAAVEKVRISADGNVGIGTKSPEGKLHIYQPSGAGPFLITRGANKTGVNYQISVDSSKVRLNAYGDALTIFTAAVGNGTNASEKMRITSGGNVGIGTTAPGVKLQVNAVSSIVNELILKLDGGSNGFSGNNDANIKHGLVYDLCSYSVATGIVQRQAAKIEVQKAGSWNEASGGSGTKADLVFSTNNGTIATPAMVEGMRIKANGNVGIGTTAPGTKLDVDGAITAGTADSTSGSVLMYGKYSNGHLATIGTEYSNGGLVLGYGVTPSTTAAGGFVSSSAVTNLTRGAYSFAAGTHKWWSDPVNATIAVGTTSPLNNTMTLLDTGELGIGTTSPGAKLTIADPGGATTRSIQIEGNTSFTGINGTVGVFSNGTYLSTNYYYDSAQVKPVTAFGQVAVIQQVSQTSGNNFIDFSVSDHTDPNSAPDSRMRILDTGNVGIGTTNPNYKLSVDDNTITTVPKTVLQFDAANISNNGGYNIDFRASTNDAADRYVSRIRGTREASGALSQLSFWTESGTALEQRMTIRASGNVGIGQTAPGSKLHISSDSANQLYLERTGTITGKYRFGIAGATNRFYISDIAQSADRFVINELGNIGIGTDSPGYKLTVSSGTADIGILTASSDSGSYVGFLDNATSTIPKIGAVGNKLILDASQYVGIKRTDPSYALDVSGTIRATGNVIAYSDARVKENVETIPNALDKVKAMRGVNYNKIGEEKREVGVIAQEVLEVLPEVVHQDEQGMYSVAYGNIVGVLIEAIKELTKEVEDLKKQLK